MSEIRKEGLVAALPKLLQNSDSSSAGEKLRPEEMERTLNVTCTPSPTMHTLLGRKEIGRKSKRGNGKEAKKKLTTHSIGP